MRRPHFPFASGAGAASAFQSDYYASTPNPSVHLPVRGGVTRPIEKGRGGENGDSRGVCSSGNLFNIYSLRGQSDIAALRSEMLKL